MVQRHKDEIKQLQAELDYQSKMGSKQFESQRVEIEQLQAEKKKLKDGHMAILKEINDNPALHNDLDLGRLYTIAEQALTQGE